MPKRALPPQRLKIWARLRNVCLQRRRYKKPSANSVPPQHTRRRHDRQPRIDLSSVSERAVWLASHLIFDAARIVPRGCVAQLKKDIERSAAQDERAGQPQIQRVVIAEPASIALGEIDARLAGLRIPTQD